MAVMERIGAIPPTEVFGHGINRLSNILTLSTGMHKSFNSLFWWLKPIPGQASSSQDSLDLVLTIT